MTPIRAQALHLALDIEDIPSKTPGLNWSYCRHSKPRGQVTSRLLPGGPCSSEG